MSAAARAGRPVARPRLLWIALVCVLVALATIPLYALWVAFGPRENMAPDFTLVDQDGAPFTLSHLRGHPVVLFFGYTHCPDACPTTLARLARAVHENAVVGDTRVVFVTVDPERDSTAALKRYVHIFDPHFIGLTGALSKLEPVYSAYRVWREAVPFKHGPDDYSMAHSTAVYYIDYRGQIRALGNWDDDLQLVVHDLKELS